MTALSNQLSKVSEPLKNNFDRLTQTMEINEGAINKLRALRSISRFSRTKLASLANLLKEWLSAQRAKKKRG